MGKPRHDLLLHGELTECVKGDVNWQTAKKKSRKWEIHFPGNSRKNGNGKSRERNLNGELTECVNGDVDWQIPVLRTYYGFTGIGFLK
jgi:hypothetical protein